MMNGAALWMKSVVGINRSSGRLKGQGRSSVGRITLTWINSGRSQTTIGACDNTECDNDCNDANKASDIMGYGWPQDHFGPTATSYLTTSVLGDYQ